MLPIAVKAKHRHFSRKAVLPPEAVLKHVNDLKCFVCTNDQRVILHLIQQVEDLGSRGLFRRAATVWMEAFRESHFQSERNHFLVRRERYLRKSKRYMTSGDGWYLSGNYVGA